MKRSGTGTAKRVGARRKGLHYFLIRARARQKGEGAYVSCWVDFPSQSGALVLAKHYIRQTGWVVRSVQEQHWFELSSVAANSRKYFLEAKRDGASFVFHRYPLDRREPTKRKAAKKR